ncbi:holo-ACP synthase [bacterium]|nr:holo-ACP synthase [bacterium]MBU1984017.1 holo-ACP synthase [bacterium]
MHDPIPPKPILPSVGIDLMEVERIRLMLDDEEFLNRIFTEQERSECLRRLKPEECLAARWAAKEAVAKALGVGIGKFLTFQDVEVIVGERKAPYIRIHGPYSHHPMRIALSLSHTRTTAAAMVMIFPGELEEGQDS